MIKTFTSWLFSSVLLHNSRQQKIETDVSLQNKAQRYIYDYHITQLSPVSKRKHSQPVTPCHVKYEVAQKRNSAASLSTKPLESSEIPSSISKKNAIILYKFFAKRIHDLKIQNENEMAYETDGNLFESCSSFKFGETNDAYGLPKQKDVQQQLYRILECLNFEEFSSTKVVFNSYWKKDIAFDENLVSFFSDIRIKDERYGNQLIEKYRIQHRLSQIRFFENLLKELEEFVNNN